MPSANLLGKTLSAIVFGMRYGCCFLFGLLASGYLPNYLYDLKALNQNYSMKEWYQLAQINTRAKKYEQQDNLRHSSRH